MERNAKQGDDRRSHEMRTQGRGTTASPGETSPDSRTPAKSSDPRNSSPDPRGQSSSTTGLDMGGSRGAGRDENTKDDSIAHSEMNSARSGVDEPQDKDPKAKGNIRNPDPNKPDPTGVPTVDES